MFDRCYYLLVQGILEIVLCLRVDIRSIGEWVVDFLFFYECDESVCERCAHRFDDDEAFRGDAVLVVVDQVGIDAGLYGVFEIGIFEYEIWIGVVKFEDCFLQYGACLRGDSFSCGCAVG